MRADAQRNRDAILAAARATFEEEGVLASLDGIALRAGIGNATLYRNFPTRNDLLAAVMETTLMTLLANAEALAQSEAPRDALAQWLLTLTWQLRIWHDLPYCVASAQGEGASSLKALNAQLMAATGKLLAKAQSAGEAVQTVSATDLFELVTTLSWGVDRFDDDEPAAARRVAMATAGIFRVTA